MKNFEKQITVFNTLAANPKKLGNGGQANPFEFTIFKNFPKFRKFLEFYSLKFSEFENFEDFF